MNPEHIKGLAENLEREVEDAKLKGYENADCVLTEEMRGLLVLAGAGMITAPVDLEFTAGPARISVKLVWANVKNWKQLGQRFARPSKT